MKFKNLFKKSKKEKTVTISENELSEMAAWVMSIMETGYLSPPAEDGCLNKDVEFMLEDAICLSDIIDELQARLK